MMANSAVFINELELINSSSIRNFVEICIAAAPGYATNDCPSSSSGKYHPADELGPDGNVRHTRKVVKMACLLMEGMEQFDLNDEVIAACIIHDLRKQGVEKSGHTVKNHADLAAALVMEVAVANPGSIEDESFQLIYNGVGYHYGPWSHGEWACSRFYSDVDVFSRLVHVADYLASRKEIGSKISL